MQFSRRRVLRALSLSAIVLAPLGVACSGETVGPDGSGTTPPPPPDTTGTTPPPGGGSPGVPYALTIIGGNNQPDTTVGSALKDPLVVRVTDGVGSPLRSVPVTWTVSSGGGSLGSASTTTDENGRAQTTWTLGAAVGSQTVTARSGTLTPAVFSMNAKGGAAATITKIAGDAQSALVNLAVGNQLKVRVLDAFGNPVKDASVVWTPSGDGIAAATTATTDVDGYATATWQLGSEPGAQTVRVAVNGKQTIFNATATIVYNSLDAGDFHACGITPSNQAFCWGFGGDGQLGTGNTTNRNVPTAVSTSLTFRQISGGKYHTCGITLAGVGYCWGQNVDGRLGTNNTTPSTSPQQVSTSVTFDSISSGIIHTCGLSRSGLVYCWGFNQEGEVGAAIPPADSVIVKVPRPVSSRPFRSVSTGGLHACALDQNSGAAYCWGFNASGQLGRGNVDFGTLGNTPVWSNPPGDTPSYYVGLPTPVTMPAGVSSFKAITAGYKHSCALATDGTAYCWGENTDGQIGNGGGGDVSVPTAVQTSLKFTQIAAGKTHTCAVATDGTVWCWGDNSNGKFGNNSTTSSTIPVQGAQFSGSPVSFVSVTAGEVLSCGISTAKAVYCWGNNDYGQLGNATNTPSLVAVKGAFQP
jgi:alpha-tubulin suppressor-like RCC1 family protein